MHGREGILKFRYGSVPTRDQGLDGRILNRVYKNRVGSNGLVNASAQYRDQRWAVVNAILELRVALNVGSFLNN
jgi:hypothetical protein